MSIAFGLPLALAALSALLIPLLMHLDRRRSLQTMSFAALRWIGSGHPPQRSLRLIERLLLILRLLLIALIALWLAKPELIGEWRAPQRWLAVVPGVSATAIQNSRVNADRVVWLKPGFPSIDQARTDPSAPQHRHDTASLIRQLDSELESADQLHVLLPAIVSGLDARAISLSREVDWQIDRGAQIATTPSMNVPSKLRRLAIRFDPSATPALPWLHAAIAAWSTSPTLSVDASIEPIDFPFDEDIGAIIWLGSEPSAEAMQRAAQGATLLHVPLTGSESTPMNGSFWPGRMQRAGRGQVIRLNAPLDPKHLPLLHDARFATELHQRLFGNPAAPDRAIAEHVEPTVITRDRPTPRTDLRRWLGWLIAGLFVLERLIASGRRLRGTA